MFIEKYLVKSNVKVLCKNLIKKKKSIKENLFSIFYAVFAALLIRSFCMNHLVFLLVQCIQI